MSFWNFLSPIGPTDQQVVFASADALANPIGSVARACINRITSRAAYAVYKDVRLPNMPSGNYGKHEFYTELFEQVLTEGWACAYPVKTNEYKVAISYGSSYDTMLKEWHLRVSSTQQTYKKVPREKVLFVTLRPLVGQDDYIPLSPLAEIRDAMLMYEHGRRQQSDYAERGAKVGIVLQTTKEVTNEKTHKNLMDGIRTKLQNSAKNYNPITTPIETQAVNTPQVHVPAKGIIEYATQEISRFYGVPLQMLQTDSAPTADEERVESRLLVDAVLPLLDRVCIGWTRLLEQDVSYEPMSVSRPTLGARSAHLKNLAQAGIYLVDELREYMGKPPLPNGQGQIIASPAGGVDHSESTGKSETNQ